MLETQRWVSTVLFSKGFQVARAEIPEIKWGQNRGFGEYSPQGADMMAHKGWVAVYLGWILVYTHLSTLSTGCFFRRPSSQHPQGSSQPSGRGLAPASGLCRHCMHVVHLHNRQTTRFLFVSFLNMGPENEWILKPCLTWLARQSQYNPGQMTAVGDHWAVKNTRGYVVVEDQSEWVQVIWEHALVLEQCWAGDTS